MSAPAVRLNNKGRPHGGKGGTVKGAKKQLSEAELQRRRENIKKYQHLGVAASVAAITPERRSQLGIMGGTALQNKIRAMEKATSGDDKPEAIRLRRLEIEGKRDKLLDELWQAAQDSTGLEKDDLATKKAVLSELRAEIRLLLDREDRAKAAGSGPPIPGRTTTPSAPAIPAEPVTPTVV